MNEEIGARNLRVVDDEGAQVGVMTRADALAHAESLGLDLVEVAADADPPVCRVIDYGRWRFDEERRLRPPSETSSTAVPRRCGSGRASRATTMRGSATRRSSSSAAATR